MEAATHIRKIPRNPYRGVRSHAATLTHDLTYEESRPLPMALREKAGRMIGNLSSAQIIGDFYIREFVAQTYSNEICAERVVLVPGAKYGLRIALEAIVNPGDEVLIPDPGYLLYDRLVHLCKGVATPYPLTKEDNFQISYETLHSLMTEKTRAIILNSPALPMGTVFSRETLKIISDIACEYDLVVISDEVLKTLSEIDCPSIAILPEMAERTVIVESISKRFLLTQWRAGWLVLPPSLIEAVAYILANGAPLAQDSQAVLAVLLQREYAKDSWVWDPRAELREKRRKTIDILSRNSLFSAGEYPVAGNWLFPYITGKRFDDTALTKGLAEREIGVLPGSIFGAQGKQHIAISCAQEPTALEQSLIALQIACENVQI